MLGQASYSRVEFLIKKIWFRKDLMHNHDLTKHGRLLPDTDLDVRAHN